MSTDTLFTPRSLTASEYVLELFEAEENVAILVRNRSTGRTIQRIARSETISSPQFQNWFANQFDGDLAATDTTRVLRLPGFANRKLPDEFTVKVRQETKAVYTLRDFAIHDDSLEQSRYRVQERKRTMPADHKSQSEDDWAFAKRTLARGDDPETVIRRIADYRADDKDNPEYYARHTVTKAKADL